jgi:hypothetical protein
VVCCPAEPRGAPPRRSSTALTLGRVTSGCTRCEGPGVAGTAARRALGDLARGDSLAPPCTGAGTALLPCVGAPPTRGRGPTGFASRAAGCCISLAGPASGCTIGSGWGARKAWVWSKEGPWGVQLLSQATVPQPVAAAGRTSGDLRWSSDPLPSSMRELSPLLTPRPASAPLPLLAPLPLPLPLSLVLALPLDFAVLRLSSAPVPLALRSPSIPCGWDDPLPEGWAAVPSLASTTAGLSSKDAALPLGPPRLWLWLRLWRARSRSPFTWR